MVPRPYDQDAADDGAGDPACGRKPRAAGCPHPALQPEPGNRADHGPEAQALCAEQGRPGRPRCDRGVDPVLPCRRCRLCGHQRQAEGRGQGSPGRHRKRTGWSAGAPSGARHGRCQDAGDALRHPQCGQIDLYQHVCGFGPRQSRRPPRRDQGQAVGQHREVRPAGHARCALEKV